MARDHNADDMHRHVGWMVPADISILGFLNAARTQRGEPAIQTPNTIALNTGYSNRHTSARCQVLADRGLIERTGKGRYRLLELGERVVANDITAEELRKRTGDGSE